MVSLWPWKGKDNSPASFERILSTLSAKISKSGDRLDGLRQRSRRLHVLLSLYAGFTYLLYTIILILVIGWRNWGLMEWAAVAGGPVVFYLLKLGLRTYYDYRISSIQAHIDDLQKQRDVAIGKLKAATKYDSTQELLKKYGNTPSPKAKPVGDANRKGMPKPDGVPRAPRTPFVPPPTANLPGRERPPPLHTTPGTPTQLVDKPGGQQDMMPFGGSPGSSIARRSPNSPTEEFAPNAFSAPPQYAPATQGSRWYDRITDALLGEDETRPGACLALICNKCRLVNGQAPPGVKRLEDLGGWRCGGCGTMNGEVSEVKRIVSSMKDRSQEKGQTRRDEQSGGDIPRPKSEVRGVSSAADEDYESEVTRYSSEETTEKDDETRKSGSNTDEDHFLKPGELDEPRRRSTRSTKGKKP